MVGIAATTAIVIVDGMAIVGDVCWDLLFGFVGTSGVKCLRLCLRDLMPRPREGDTCLLIGFARGAA